MIKFRNEVIESIWNDRHRKNDETLVGTFARVANHVSLNEKEAKDFYYIMSEGLFMPAGRTMSNAGIGQTLTLNNCFLNPVIPDDMGGIFDCVKFGALTHKAGGGLGYDFSLIRPNGSETTNHATASGVVSFMKVFNAQTDTVMQGSRRGANMGVLNIYHPDIIDFITAKSVKQDEENKCSFEHFNLSVMVDDNFMKAVSYDEPIFLHYPVYDEHYRIITDPTKWTHKKEVRAVELWDMIMEMAYNSGEPGVLFYDTLNEFNNTWYTETITHTNPCFTGDMKLLTDNGYKTFEELCDTEPNIINKNGNKTKGKVWCSGEKETIELNLSNKTKIKCTPNHVFMTIDGEEIEAQELKGKRIKTYIDLSEFNLIDIKSPKVLSIKSIGVNKVYDFTETETHWGVVNGCIAHNCAEFIGGTIFDQKLPSSEYGGACNLGSLILPNFVINPFKKDAKVNINLLKHTIKKAVRMLDNIIDINKYPLKHYENYQKNMRTIGLGVMGLADMLIMLGLRYGSNEEALDFIDDLIETITLTAYEESVELAKEKGEFPFYRKEFLQSEFIHTHLEGKKREEWKNLVNKIEEHGIRNARLISIAPTGTLAMVYGNNCSSGIEPIFQLSYDRKIKLGGQNESNARIVKMEDYAYSLYQEYKSQGYYKDFDESLFVTALDISVDDHIDVLETIANHVDMAVSKTINVPEEYSFKQVKEIYMSCWKKNIKGCTIFRPNELREGVLTKSKSDENKETDQSIDNDNKCQNSCENCSKNTLPRGYELCVSDDLIAYKKTIVNGCGKFYLHSDFDEVTGEQLETYIDIGSEGGCERNYQFISRLMSKLLRNGVSVEEIIDQGKSIRPCNAYLNRTKTKGDTSRGTSCPSAIAFALEDLNNKIKDRCFADPEEEILDEDNITIYDFEKEPVKTKPEPPYKVSPKNLCPDCGEPLAFEGGCNICKACGWSKCN